MPTSPLTVLVVDDNEASAKTMAWTVELLGCNALIARDGKQALRMAEEHVPDIIMLDIGLPDVSGYDICQQLKNNSLFADTAIIAQTGWGEASHIRQAREAGFDHHLIKPVEIEKLKAIIYAVSQLKRHEAAPLRATA